MIALRAKPEPPSKCKMIACGAPCKSVDPSSPWIQPPPSLPRAARRILTAAERSIAARGRFHLVLAGGRTPASRPTLYSSIGNGMGNAGTSFWAMSAVYRNRPRTQQRGGRRGLSGPGPNPNGESAPDCRRARAEVAAQL